MYRMFTSSLHRLRSFWQEDRFQKLPLVLIIAILSLIPSWNLLFQKWFNDSEGYSHGPLILLMSLWLCWRSFQEPALISQKLENYLAYIPRSIWVIGLGLSLTLWWLSFVTLIATVEMALIPIIILCLLGACFGTKILWQFLFPIGFLYFAIPIWDILTPLLQTLAASATQYVLRATSIPAFIQNIHVTIPYGKFVIEDGCSGLRYLVISLSLATFYAGLYLHRWQNRGLLIATAIILSVIFNWIRILSIIYIGFYTKMQSSLVKDHENFGWLIYAVMLVALLGFGRWLENREALNNANFIKSSFLEKNSKEPTWWVVILFSLIICAIYAQELRIKFSPNMPSSLIDTYPELQHRFEHSPWPNWAPQFHNADNKLSFYSKRFDKELYGFYAQFLNQKQGKELFNSTQGISQQDINWEDNYKLDENFRMGNISLSRNQNRIYLVHFRAGDEFISPQANIIQRIKRSIYNWLQTNRYAEALVLTTTCESENYDAAEQWLKNQWQQLTLE